VKKIGGLSGKDQQIFTDNLNKLLGTA